MPVEREFHPQLYPERPELGLDSHLEVLSRTPEIVLSPEEKNTVLQIENLLTTSPNLNQETIEFRGQQIPLHHTDDEGVTGIENAWKIKVNTTDFFTDYFKTEDGYKDLVEHLGWDVSIPIDIFLAQGQFNAKANVINAVAGRSRDYAQKRMVNEFEESGFTAVDGVHNPEQVTIVRNPDALVDQFDEYSKLKKYLHNFQQAINESDSAFSEATRTVVEMNMRRLNQLLAGSYPDLVAFLKQSKRSEDEDHHKLAQKIREIVGTHMFHVLYKDPGARMFERLDKFINGVGDKVGDIYTVLSPEVLEVADQAGKSQPEKVKGKFDVSEEVLESIVIDAKSFQHWFKEVLAESNLLSVENEDLYDKDRSGPPADGKWQVILDPNRSSIVVEDRQRVILVPEKFRRSIASINPAGAVPVLDHEDTHVVQNENRRKLGLGITRNVRMDRSDIYSEAGAVARETECQEELFGHTRDANPHYLRAMQAKLAGGSLRDCMKAFYDSLMQSDPEMSQRKAAEQAVDRAMRLFRNGGQYDDDSVHLTNSQPLVYLEQDILVQKLKESGCEKLLYVNGVNLEMLAKLHRVGLVDLDKITVPKKHPSEVIMDEIEALINNAKKETNET